MQANLQHKTALLSFWERFGKWTAKGDYSGFNKEHKIEALQKMAALVLEYRRQQPIEKRREVFDSVKKNLCRQKIGAPCFGCSHPGFNRHHIIQLQNGGINSRRNLVILCDDCHAEIHPWLTVKTPPQSRLHPRR